MIGGKTFVRLPSTNLFLAIKGGNGNPFDFVLQQLSTAINTGPSYLLGNFFLETFSGIRSVETWSPERTHPDLTAKGYM
jgi:hypothetical protein